MTLPPKAHATPIPDPAEAPAAAVLDDLLMNVIFRRMDPAGALDDALRRAEEDGRSRPGDGAILFPRPACPMRSAAFSDWADRRMLAARGGRGGRRSRASRCARRSPFLVSAPALEALETHKEAGAPRPRGPALAAQRKAGGPG